MNNTYLIDLFFPACFQIIIYKVFGITRVKSVEVDDPVNFNVNRFHVYLGIKNSNDGSSHARCNGTGNDRFYAEAHDLLPSIRRHRAHAADHNT